MLRRALVLALALAAPAQAATPIYRDTRYTPAERAADLVSRMTLDEKAAALLLAVMRNHPLADGNKRLAWFVTVAFLELNDLDLVVDDVVEADGFLREVAAGTVDLDGVAAWVRARIRPLV